MAEMTPMMRQCLEIKEQNKDAILFFRLGDFYEMFNEDALTASRELDLTLTTREDRCDPADGLYDLPRLAVTMDRSARDCFSLKTNILLFIKEFKP